MKKFDALPTFTLVAIIIYYLPFFSSFVLPKDLLLVWEGIYKIIDPFLIMPIFIGAMSLYFLDKDYKPGLKIIFIIIYGLSLFVALFTTFFVLNLSLKKAAIFVVPHLIFVILHFYVLRNPEFKKLK